MNVQDKVIIVTGSSSGVGAAAVKQLAAKGANVVINYSRSETAALEVAESCEKAGGGVLVMQATYRLMMNAESWLTQPLRNGGVLMAL